MKLLALSALLCALMAPTLTADCPKGVNEKSVWTKIGNRSFLYIEERQSWTKAEKCCIELGGHLASVHSLVEYRQVQPLAQGPSGGFDETWIGGNDLDHEGVWRWSDDTDFDYTYWCLGEPNDAGRNEDCLQINFSGSKCWNDLWCHHTLPSICVRTSPP